MNQNAIIAVLVHKGILTKDEGEKLSEYIANSPQSTYLADAIEQVKEFVGKEAPKLEAAAKSAAKTLEDDIKAEAQKVAQAEVKKSNPKK